MDENERIELTETTARSKSNTKRIDRIEQRQDETDKLVGAMTELRVEQQHIKTDVLEIKSDVKQIAMKPARRWDALWTAIIGAVAGVLIGLLFRGV